MSFYSMSKTQSRYTAIDIIVIVITLQQLITITRLIVMMMISNNMYTFRDIKVDNKYKIIYLLSLFVSL